MFGKKREDVPETITDDTWIRIQRGAAKSVPVIPGPWDPAGSKKLATWKAIRQNAEQN